MGCTVYNKIVGIYGNVIDEIVLRDDGVFISTLDTSDNPDDVAYRDWVSAGNTPGAAVPHPGLTQEPSPVLVVTPWQIRKALNQLGLRDAVESYVASASQDAKDAWEFATQFERNHPFIVACGAALGKSDAEIDALFQLAVTL